MSGKEIELESWRIAAQNAAPIGLVIILYDLLASDLRSAIEAIRNGDVEKRCRDINHAFLVLGQLQGYLDMGNSGEPARSLSLFYSHLRGKILEAQIKISAEMLQHQIELIVDVRRAWEQVESRERSSNQPASWAGALVDPSACEDVAVSSWSA
jgi:flagellar secretion chaperone FliS